MFNKNNQQNHYGIGNQIIDQSTHITANFYGYSNTPPSNDGADLFFNTIIGVVFFFLLILLNTLVPLMKSFKNYQWIVLGIFVLLSITSAVYVYKKSEKANYVALNIGQYLINILSTYAAVNFELPDKVQTFLSSIQGNIDFSSKEKFVETIFKSISSFIQHKQEGLIGLIYLLIFLTTLLSIISITKNVFFRKTIKDNTPGFVIIFWIIFIILINLYNLYF